MIEIDGAAGEGGGQILRTALALSLATGQAFRLVNIRANRPKPGLMRQHLACVQAAVAVGGGPEHARALGAGGTPAQLGETQLSFTPGPVAGGDYRFAVGSAGSCMLVLQTVLWPLVLAKAPSTLELSGGTHNPMAPSCTFLSELAPWFAAQGPALFELELLRHGFYPAGGGEVRARIQPPAGGLRAMDLMARGELVEAWVDCLHAGLPANVPRRELEVLARGLGWPEERLRNRGLRGNEGPGNVLQAVLKYQHVTEVLTHYGEKGVSAEQVAHGLLRDVRAYMAQPAPVGEHLADQLMLPLALAAWQGRPGQFWGSTLSSHARTNAQTIARFLPVTLSTRAHQGGHVVSAA